MNTARVDRLTKRLGIAAALIGFLYWADGNTNPMDMESWDLMHPSENIPEGSGFWTVPEDPGVIDVLKDQRFYWNSRNPWIWIALAALTIGPFYALRFCGWVIKGWDEPEQDGKSD